MGGLWLEIWKSEDVGGKLHVNGNVRSYIPEVRGEEGEYLTSLLKSSYSCRGSHARTFSHLRY